MAGKTVMSSACIFLFCAMAIQSYGNAQKRTVLEVPQIDNSMAVTSEVGKINTADGFKWNAVFDKETSSPRMIYGGLSRGSGNPAKIAYDFLKANLEMFRIEDQKDLRIQSETTSPGSTHVVFMQYFKNLPVFDSSVGVHMTKNGLVELVTNSFKSPKEMLPETIEGWISMDEAELIAEKSAGSPANKEKVRIEQGFIVNGDGLSRVWRIYYPTLKPSGALLLDIDYYSGAVLRRVNADKSATGIGVIHKPNPLASPQRSTVELTSLLQPGPEDNFSLTGLFFEVLNGKSEAASLPIPEFDYIYAFDESLKDEPEESDPHYEEVVVYYYMESFRSYCRELGFQLFGNNRIKAYAHGSDMDLSWYSHEERSITFGEGGVNDATDADIIIHELGHAVLDFIKPSIFYATGEAAAMHEGYSDYFAASFTDDPCLMEWDSHIIKTACFRTVDNTKCYPKDSIGSSYEVGEIWSGTLWDIREEIILKEPQKGKDIADSLALKSVYYLPENNPSFKEAAIALQIASTNLYNGRYNNLIRAVLKERGLL